MPSGVHLTKTYLEQIWHCRIVLEMSTVAIFESVFQSDTNKIGLAYLQTLCNLCDGGDNNNRFFGPRLPRSGGPDLKIGPIAQAFFLDIFAQQPQKRLKRAREEFSVDYYGGIDVPCLSAFSRVLKRAKITRNVLER
jgi:hypothetical protein